MISIFSRLPWKVLTEVETSMMRTRLVGRRMEAEVALKVLVYLISCRSNQILSMRLPFFNISPNTGWLSIAADPRLAYQTVEAFNDDTEAAMMRIRSVEKRMEAKVAFELVSLQPDFVNEVTLLQYFTEQRSSPAGCQLLLIRSTKWLVCCPNNGKSQPSENWPEDEVFSTSRTVLHTRQLKHSTMTLRQQTRTLRPRRISLTELSKKGSLVWRYRKMEM